MVVRTRKAECVTKGLRRPIKCAFESFAFIKVAGDKC